MRVHEELVERNKLAQEEHFCRFDMVDTPQRNLKTKASNPTKLIYKSTMTGP